VGGGVAEIASSGDLAFSLGFAASLVSEYGEGGISMDSELP
jgi:hypothetical protein